MGIRIPLFLLALSSVLTWAGAAADPEIDDLQRSEDRFGYFQLGKHVPKRSGWANYVGARTVIHTAIGLPLEIDPKNHSSANRQHMYCNTQVWGFDKTGRPTGKSNHLNNYSFPWSSTFCERRDFAGTNDQLTKRCGTGDNGRLRKSHQGSDCRPPAPVADKYWMIAVEDGVVVRARRNLVELNGTSGIKWKYRHGGAPRDDIVPRNGRGVPVTKGTRLARVTDLVSTSIHLHLESERPAGSDRDNLPSLILAYQRALDVAETPVAGGELQFDDRFEVPNGIGARPCRESEDFSDIGTAATFRFDSYWCHNDSIIGLARDGDHVRLVYHRPRPGIRDAAARNPVLFDGTVTSGALSGQAIWYNRRCTDRTFEVTGESRTIGTVSTMTLTGKRPSFTGPCDRPQFLDETLSFTLIRSETTDGGGTEPDGDGEIVPEFGVRIAGPCGALASSRPIDDFDRFDFASLWCHNGSLMGHVESGSERRFVYFKPKPSLRGSVDRNPTLFDGRIQNGRYSGSSLRFNKACGDPAFDVTGEETSVDGRRTVVLSGRRPVLNSNCAPRRHVEEELKFTFLAKLKEGGSGNQPIEDTSCKEVQSQPAINPAEAIEVSSLWCHDNSVIGMAEDGDARKLFYYKPQDSIRAFAQENPQLLESTVRAGAYEGVLRWTDDVCGSRDSTMAGSQTTIGGVPTITLAGDRPDPDQPCESGARVEKTVKLTFLNSRSVTYGGQDGTSPSGTCRDDPASEAVRRALSGQKLRAFSSAIRSDLAEALRCHAGYLADASIAPGLSLVHFMTQVATETGGIRRLDENMNYSARRLLEVFPTRVTPQKAQELQGKPRQIANHVYGNRLGNRGRHTDDGWTYRGSGFLQLTGRENFRKRGDEVGLPLEENPEMARQPNAGLLAAAAYWTARNINKAAKRDQLVKVRSLVNGGTNGLAEARVWYQRAKSVFMPDTETVPADQSARMDAALGALLVERGFLEATTLETPRGPAEISAGLKAYQRSRGLPETGILDDETLYAITDPREWRN